VKLPIRLDDVAQLLELEPAQLWSRSMRELQALARGRRRELAKAYHPDLAPEAGARMARINALVDAILAENPEPERPAFLLRRPAPPPRPVVRWGGFSVTFAYGQGHGPHTTTGTSTSWAEWSET